MTGVPSLPSFNVAAANGVTTVFNFTFFAYDNTYIKVYSVLDDVLTAITTGITIAVNSSFLGGTVTFTTAPATAVGDILIRRELPYTQETEFADLTRYKETAIETALNSLALQIQQLKSFGDLGLRYLENSGVTAPYIEAPTDGRLLAFDGTTGRITSIALADVAGDLSGVFTGLSSGDYIRYNGTNWVNITKATVKTDLDIILDKRDATVAPTANEDTGDGYAVGSFWHDVTADASYVCLDATATAAVWRRIDQVMASQAEAEAGTDNAKLMTSLRVVQGVLALGASVAEMVTSTANKIVTAANFFTYMNSYVPRIVHTQVPTAATTCVIGYTFRAGYDYEIRLDGISVGTDNASLFLEMSSDDGASYVTAAGSYSWQRIYGTSTAAGDQNTSTTSISLTAYGMDANEPLFGIIEMLDPCAASHVPTTMFRGTMIEAATSIPAHVTGVGRRLTTMACNKVRLVSSTNFNASGKITVWEKKCT